MPPGPRPTPYPVVVQFSDSANPTTPTKLLESSSLFVTSFSAITISATNYVNLPAAQVDYNLLNTYYLNSSGDSASAGFYLSSVSATNLSATNYFNLPSSTLVWNQAQDIVLYVKNKTNFSLPKGTPVAIVSATGDNPIVEPLSSVNTHVPEAYGFANHVAGLVKDTISANGFGYIVVEGLIEGNGGADPLNTNAFQVGDTLYVSSNGQLSNVRPPAPYESHPVGFVIRTNNNNGKILVKIENQPEINDIVGFNLNPTLINGDLIAYDLTTSTFKNTQALNLSGASRFGSVSATSYLNLPVSSHSQLTGLNANDHPQYVLSATNSNLSSLVTNIQTSTVGLSSTLGAHLTSAVHWNLDTLNSNYINASGDSANAAFFFQNLSATNLSATNYLNLPVSSHNQLLNLGANDHPQYVLTSVNTNLSSLVNNIQTSTVGLSSTLGAHLTSAVHWSLDTLNTNYLNASGDSANAAFFLQTLSSTTFSATNYLNLPVSALSALSDTQITSPALSSVLKWNGSKWVPATDQTGGGGGSPGGNTGDIQFNDGGAFGGTAQLNWNSISNLLSGTNATFVNLSATTFSATTYQNLPVSALSGLSDTQITSPSDGNSLVWSGTKWIASSISAGGGGGATALSGLTDVSVTSTPTTGYVLKWTGSSWQPALDLPVITSGTAEPTGGNDGDIYIQYT